MSWYYVEDADRKGPVDRSEIETLIKVNTIGAEDFIWSKGLDDWVKASEVEQFSHCFNSVSDAANIEAPPVVAFNFSDYSSSQKLFFIRVGLDRGGVATDYGPFSLNTLKKLYKENRVNAKTLVYTKGIPSWTLLSNAKDFEVVFEEVPPVLGEVEEITDKREFTRKPFVARMFFQNNQEVYEGICRDISIGGMQVLIADYPIKVSDKISINVHPENTDFHFVADGEVVRCFSGDSGFSFRFLNLSDDAAAAISEYLKG